MCTAEVSVVPSFTAYGYLEQVHLVGVVQVMVLVVARLVKLHTQSHCVLPALGVPGVNRKPLVSIMQSHLSLQLHRSIHVHFKSCIHRVEESLCAACAVIENHWDGGWEMSD